MVAMPTKTFWLSEGDERWKEANWGWFLDFLIFSPVREKALTCRQMVMIKNEASHTLCTNGD